MTARALVKEADWARAFKAAIKAGLRPGQFEVRGDPAGGLRVITFAQGAEPTSADPNPWDSVAADGEG